MAEIPICGVCHGKKELFVEHCITVRCPRCGNLEPQLNLSNYVDLVHRIREAQLTLAINRGFSFPSYFITNDEICPICDGIRATTINGVRYENPCKHCGGKGYLDTLERGYYDYDV